ncbi:MAG: hypothetical protein CMP29_10135 [Roseibacillus sp.]|nr:hypothetical protein [Roseibacillus sp.]
MAPRQGRVSLEAMAFFPRRKREDSQPERSREGAAEPAESTDAPTTDTDVTSGAQTDDAAADAAAQEAAASVNISMSSFRGLGGGPSAAARPSKPTQPLKSPSTSISSRFVPPPAIRSIAPFPTPPVMLLSTGAGTPSKSSSTTRRKLQA